MRLLTHTLKKDCGDCSTVPLFLPDFIIFQYTEGNIITIQHLGPLLDLIINTDIPCLVFF